MSLAALPHFRRLRICDDCLKRTRPLFANQTQELGDKRYFHPSHRKLSDAFPDHYATLELPSTADPAEIKKQFYALSKKYHPDVNPDPAASERFVKISEAYHVLGSAEKKGKYDWDFHRAHAGPASRSGSYHSRGPAGGRPASGLSKRRSQFRGPPPSFYAQGGYGTQGAKRQRAQQEADERHHQQHGQQQGPMDSDHPSGLGSQPNYGGTGGFSPGWNDFEDPDPTMPYFDKAGHKRTHDGLGARTEEREQRRRPPPDPSENRTAGGSMLGQFLIVSAVVMVAISGASFIMDFFDRTGKQSGQGIGKKRVVRDNG